MATVERTDASDPRLRDFVGLTDARLRRALEPELGLFMAEGERIIGRALGAGFRLRTVLTEQRWLAGLLPSLEALDGVDVLVVEPEVLRDVTGYQVHRGALATFERRPLPEPAELVRGADRVAVLEGMVDPTNVGAVFRAAAALGMDAVLLDPRCADPLYRRAVRVSMGAVLALPYARFDRWPAGLDQVRAAGLTVLALAPAPDAVPIDDLDPACTARCAVLLGTEGEGLTPRAQAAADLRVRIPMRRGVDSLNVAAAAAVAFHAVSGGGSG
jgi:tRNA G18 (ribose-2'-O)-methylase SpoU